MAIRRVTLQDVARAAGLSPATVSLAIRGTGAVGEDTRNRVRVLAERLGYRPDPLAASFAARRFRRGNAPESGLPVAVLGMGSQPLLTPTMAARAASLGYEARACDLGNPGQAHAIGTCLYHQGVSGVIVNIHHGLIDLPHFPWECFAVAVLGRPRHPAPFPLVRHDCHRQVVECFRVLSERGCRHIGFALGRHAPEHPDDIERMAAALYCQASASQRSSLPLFRESLADSGGLRARFVDWVRTWGPDGVVGFSPAFHYWLKEAGYDVPGDIRFAALHTGPEHDPTAETAGIAASPDAEFAHALDLLDRQIRQRTRGAQPDCTETLIPCRWIEGRSASRRRGNSSRLLAPPGRPEPATPPAADAGVCRI